MTSHRAATVFALLLGLVLGVPLPGRAGEPKVLFSDGFESGDASAWAATRGVLHYESSGCHTGKCAAAVLTGGSCDAPGLWETRSLDYTGPVLYLSFWHRWPRAYGFAKTPTCRNVAAFKLAIVNTTNRVGRTIPVLWGARPAPFFRVAVERVRPDRNSDSRWSLPTDGLWHHYEVELTRIPGQGRIRAWIDGACVLDEARELCDGKQCSPVTQVQLGAYSNGGSQYGVTYWLDDVVIATGRGGEGPHEAGVISPAH